MAGWKASSLTPPAIMFPQVGAGGGRLKPKNERVPSMTIIRDMPSTTIAEIGGTRLGSSSRTMMRKCEAPMARAAVTKSRCAKLSVVARAIRV